MRSVFSSFRGVLGKFLDSTLLLENVSRSPGFHLVSSPGVVEIGEGS